MALSWHIVQGFFFTIKFEICLRLLQARIDQQFALIAELRKTNGKFEADIEIQRQTQLMLTKQVRDLFITQNVLNASFPFLSQSLHVFLY